MSLQNITIKKIDELYGITENALDAMARNNELIITDAVGQSMRPTIVSGDRIVIDRSKIAELKAGDIIAFANNNLLVCHRIKEIRDDGPKKLFITIGDAYDNPDKFEVGTDEIAGKVTRIIKSGRYFQIFFYIRQALKLALKRFGIYRLSKKILFRVTRNIIYYKVSFPRKKTTHPAYKFVGIWLKDIINRERGFFAPLDSIGGFQIAASLGRTSGIKGSHPFIFPRKRKK